MLACAMVFDFGACDVDDGYVDGVERRAAHDACYSHVRTPRCTQLHRRCIVSSFCFRGLD